MSRITTVPGVMSVPSSWPKLVLPFIADNFDRANSTNLGSTPTGGAVWTKLNGGSAVRITDNHLSFASVTANGTVTVDASRANFRASARIHSIGATAATRGGGIAVRQSASSYWYLSTRVSSTEDGLRFYRADGGTTTGIGSTSPVVVVAGDVMTVVCDGTTLSAQVNGVTVITVTGANLETNQGVGFLAHTQGTALAIDDFSVAAV